MRRPPMQPLFTWPELVALEVVALAAWAFLLLTR